MKSTMDDLGDYRIHDSASCVFHIVLVLLVAVSTLLVCLLSWCLYYFVMFTCGYTLWVHACVWGLYWWWCWCCGILWILPLWYMIWSITVPFSFQLIFLAGDAVTQRWFTHVPQHILPFLLTPPLEPYHVSFTSATETALLPLVCLLALLCCSYWCHLWEQVLFLPIIIVMFFYMFL